MLRHLVIAFGLIAVLPSSPTTAQAPAPSADIATACNGRDGWTDPAPPARIFGDTWYVGTCGISVVLITSDQGHVLIDGGPAAAAPLVVANIEKLGFKPKDVRWIVSSHEHDDHVGALAELKRLTGAKVAALDSAAPQLAAGKLRDDDPQRKVANDFPPIVVDRVLNDREDFRFGMLQLSVRATPAHTAGSASWTWQSCDVTRCRTVTYADSATAISAEGYRFSDHPDRVEAVREGLKRMGELPCDILVTPHPGASDLFARISARKPLGDPEACRTYAAAARERFAARLAKEDAEK
jgi:metallo-beta-lactamase class B